jgi:hypothetical protein
MTVREVAQSRWSRQAAALIAAVRDEQQRDDLRLRFEERAAICEIDGKLPRAEAERIAYESLLAASRRGPG